MKYERIINDGLLTRIDALLKALRSHSDSDENPDELIFQSLIESAGDPTEDQPPPPPEGVHEKVQEQPTYSKMMAALVDQVKKEIDESKPSNRYEGYIKGVKGHQSKVLGLQQELLEKLAELERIEKSKITSESIHTGFDSSQVSKSKSPPTAASPPKKSKSISKSPPQNATVELLNPSKRGSLPHSDSYQDSGADADIEDGGPSLHQSGSDSDNEDGAADPDEAQPTELGKAFAKLPANDYRASMQYISEHPAVLAERETDGLLVHAFDAELEGNSDLARRSVHQALLLQYCRALGRDGVALFFKRITTPGHQARKLFLDDVNNTYDRLRTRAAQMISERSAAGGAAGAGEVEQIQLHAVNPGQTISITVPKLVSEGGDEGARALFDAFPPGLQRALESGKLDEVNKVLGRMSVSEAEEVVEQLDRGGMLNLEQGIIDATTDEGRAAMEEIERTGKMPGHEGEEGAAPGSGLAVVEEMD